MLQHSYYIVITLGRNKEFVNIPVTPEIKQRIKEIMKLHPIEYSTYDRVLRVACILLENFSPHIILRVCEQPFVVKELTSEQEENRKKILSGALDEDERMRKEDLRG